MSGSALFSRPFLAACLVVLLAVPATALAAPPAKKATPDPVLARINGYDIHGSAVMAQIHRLPQKTQELPMEKLVPMVVEAMINARLIDTAAENAHLDKDAEVRRRLAAAKEEIIRNVYLEHLVAHHVSDAKLHARYAQYIKSVPPREEVDARHILVKTEAEAKAIIRQLEHGASFVKLAKEKSIDPAGKDSGGDLGWFTKDQMVPEFADAAFALKKGQFTRKPVKTRFGWHVIQVIDRRKAPPPSFDDVKRQLIAQIQGEIIADKIKELRSHAKIQIMGADGKPLPTASSTGKTLPLLKPMPALKK